MMSPDAEQDRLLADEDWLALEEVVTRFDDAWRQGPRPVIDDYLPADGRRRFPLLVELVHIDLELRLRAGEPARAEEYLARYPELAGDTAAAVALIAAERELRRCQAMAVGRDTPRHPAAVRPEASPVLAGYEVLGLLG